MTTEVFGTDPQPDNQTSFLDQLVGDDKKYKTPELLAKSRLDADTYIAQLQREQAQLREELATRTSVDDAIKNFQRNTQQAPASEVQTSPAAAPAIDEKTLAERIRQVTQEQNIEQRQASNVETAARRLTETFGDSTKANQVVQQKAAELGVTVKFLQDTAAQSPQAFFSLLGLEQQATQTTQRTHSDVNVQAFGQQNSSGPKPGTYAFYEAIRQEDKKRYFSPQVQNQLMKDALEKGDAFFS